MTTNERTLRSLAVVCNHRTLPVMQELLKKCKRLEKRLAYYENPDRQRYNQVCELALEHIENYDADEFDRMLCEYGMMPYFSTLDDVAENWGEDAVAELR